MQLINQIPLETERGLRSIELYQGNITQIPFPADLLAISAFRSDYIPVRGTVISALSQDLNISVQELRQNCAFDLTTPMGIWVSKEISSKQFRRILCVELIGSGLELKELLENVFVGIAILEAKGITVGSMVLPILGAGSQELEPSEVISSLLPSTRRAIEQSVNLQRIAFVEMNPERASKLNAALDNFLGRSTITLPKKPLIQNLRADILNTVSKNESLVPEGHRNLLQEVRRVLGAETARSFEVGILGRRLVEFVVDDFLERKKTRPDLIEKIDRLGDQGVASWVRGYMHVLRILGNEAAHEKDTAAGAP